VREFRHAERDVQVPLDVGADRPDAVRSVTLVLQPEPFGGDFRKVGGAGQPVQKFQEQNEAAQPAFPHHPDEQPARRFARGAAHAQAAARASEQPAQRAHVRSLVPPFAQQRHREMDHHRLNRSGTPGGQWRVAVIVRHIRPEKRDRARGERFKRIPDPAFRAAPQHQGDFAQRVVVPHVPEIPAFHDRAGHQVQGGGKGWVFSDRFHGRMGRGVRQPGARHARHHTATRGAPQTQKRRGRLGLRRIRSCATIFMYGNEIHT